MKTGVPSATCFTVYIRDMCIEGEPKSFKKLSLQTPGSKTKELGHGD